MLLTKKSIPTLKNLLFHTMSVLCFVIYETSIIIFSEQPFNTWVLLTFYLFDIGWFYTLAYLIYPSLQKHIRKAAVKVLIGFCAITIFASFLLLMNLVILWVHTGNADALITKFLIFRSIWRGVYISIIALCFWYYKDRIAKAKDLQIQTELRLEAEKQQLELENAYLRSQVNPHLLFNSLTYLYKEALINLPNASKPVMLIAEMMDYALQPGSNGKATLREEADHIQRLVTLYKLLGTRTQQIHYTHNFENPDLLVPPLIFNHFVENLLKHGILNDESNPAIIDLTEKNNVVELYTCNKIKPVTRTGHGQGLSNTEARLKKHFAGKYELHTKTEDQLYITRLKLYL